MLTNRSRKNKSSSTRRVLDRAAIRVAAAAQRVYDDWGQDDSGYSEDYGFGGICDDVADAICDILRSLPEVLDCKTWHIADDNHTVAVVKAADGVWLVDVPASVYESGSWYKYKKRLDVKIEASDVVVEHLDSDPEKFDDYEER